jgi:hypothetical protein
MKQAIAGVSPATSHETTIMVVWPSIAKYWLGRVLGSVLAILAPDVYVFRLGVILAPLLIPFALLLYFYRLLPSFFGLPIHGSTYKLTNRRIIEQRAEVGWWKFRFDVEVKSVQLDRFNTIEIVRRPGQVWYDAGDFIFRDGATETFRLDGVSRPEAFRQACLKAHMAYVGVKKIRERQTA